MLRGFATVRLINSVVALRQKRIVARLTLPRGQGRTPTPLSAVEFKERFVEAAEVDLRQKAKRYFKRCVTRNRPWTFQFRSKATVEAFRERTRREVASQRPLIYVYGDTGLGSWGEAASTSAGQTAIGADRQTIGKSLINTG